MRMKQEKIIPKEELEVGKYYYGACRNATVARWDGIRFWYWREKFGQRFLEDIACPEDDTYFDVFRAYGIFEIPLNAGT